MTLVVSAGGVDFACRFEKRVIVFHPGESAADDASAAAFASGNGRDSSGRCSTRPIRCSGKPFPARRIPRPTRIGAMLRYVRFFLFPEGGLRGCAGRGKMDRSQPAFPAGHEKTGPQEARA